MHVPPYHKQRSWQRFLVGGFFGAILAYVIFIYMYGSMYEKLLEEKLDLEAEVTELENHNEALLEDQKDLDERAKEPITVETIEISISNKKELRLDRLMIHQLEEKIKEEIKHIIGQDINNVDASYRLLISTIENTKIQVDDFEYQFEVTKLTIFKTVKLTMDAKISN